jgi:hypothetical protein
MGKEVEQAQVFCADFFGTSQFMFDGVGFVAALAGYLVRVKAEAFKEIQDGRVVVGEQLELFQQQGFLF